MPAEEDGDVSVLLCLLVNPQRLFGTALVYLVRAGSNLRVVAVEIA